MSQPNPPDGGWGVSVSCAFGPCDQSRERGGAGCDLCDRVAKLPQPSTSTMLERQAKYAVPDASRKKAPKHPMFTKRHRKALEPVGHASAPASTAERAAPHRG
jgi:hypothetical protein